MPCGFPPFGRGTCKRILKNFMKNAQTKCGVSTLTRYANGTWMVGPARAASDKQTASQTVKPVTKSNAKKLKSSDTSSNSWTIFWYCVYSSILGISLALNVVLYMTLHTLLTK